MIKVNLVFLVLSSATCNRADALRQRSEVNPEASELTCFFCSVFPVKCDIQTSTNCDLRVDLPEALSM